MNKHPHIIARQTFDIDYPSKDNAHALQDKVSKIFNMQLMDEIGALFDRLVPQNRIIRIDSLVLDIGDISGSSLETELPRRVIDKLEQELRLLLLHDNFAQDTTNNNEHYADDEKGNYLQLLEYFLLEGSLPWWASNEDGFSMAMVLEFLFNNSSLRLRDLVLRVGQKSFVRKRLVYQFPEELIKYLIVLLEPEEAEFIFEYHQEVVQVQRDKQLVKNEESEFKKAVWLFILSYLIVEKSSNFSRKEFVKSTISSMATHFNMAFSELLALFAAGLKNEYTELRKTDSLHTIILELFAETKQSVDLIPLKNVSSKSKDVEKLSRDIELIRYYLTFGSFPWWFEYPDKQIMIDLISNMVQHQPKTISKVIRSVGQHAYSRGLMVKVLDEALLKSIVNLIEPVDGEFISDYVSEVKSMNNKENLIKTQSQDLTSTIWEFILEYLLVDRGSEFNRKVFLESNVRRLANQFNLRYQDLLIFLVQSIGTRHAASTKYISLFQTLHALYEETEDKAAAEMIVYNDPAEASIREGEMFEKIQQTGLRNVLYFWLKYGYFPWWAEKLAEKSISELIEKLIYESPNDAIVLLKFSGQKLFSRRRMLNQVSPNVLFKLFLLLPSGAKAIRYLESLISQLSKIAAFQIKEFVELERITIAALWDSYEEGSYKDFTSRQYLQFIIINLSVSTKLSVKDIVHILNTDLIEKQIRFDLNQVIKNADRFDEYIKLFEIQQDLPSWIPPLDLEQIIVTQLQAESSSNVTISKSELSKELIFILRYFLQHHKLPEKYNVSSELQEQSFLKQLLLLLYRVNAKELELILESDKYPARHYFKLHHVFKQADSLSENNLKRLLASTLEKDILLFVKESRGVSLSKETFSQFIEKYTQEAFTPSNFKLLKLLLQFPAVTTQFASYFDNNKVYELMQMEASTGTQLNVSIKTINTWILSLLGDSLDRDNLDLLIKTYNFMIIGGLVVITNIQTYFRFFLLFLSANNRGLLVKIISSITTLFKTHKYQNAEIINHIPEIEEIVHDFTEYGGTIEDLQKIAFNLDNQLIEDLQKLKPDELRDTEQLKQEILEQEKREIEHESEQSTSDKQAVYIHNAGLVILHPFLSTYFNRLQMLKGGDFISEEYRHRAVHLLQYLVFGTETNEEHNLVLNKVLCNIPVKEPIGLGIQLSDQEKAISAELLNAVLAQWEKLNNSSAESLQVSFLQREGSLTLVDENWNLKVEQRGYDVLLQTLPWGLGMIKTSWMKEFIYVEWM